jgi:hypothetical protein
VLNQSYSEHLVGGFEKLGNKRMLKTIDNMNVSENSGKRCHREKICSTSRKLSECRGAFATDGLTKPRRDSSAARASGLLGVLFV